MREFLGKMVQINAIRVLGSDCETAVAFVQIAAAGDVLVIRGELSRVLSARAIRLSGTFAGSDTVTRAHFAQAAVRLRGLIVSDVGVDWETIGCVTDEVGRRDILAQAGNQPGGKAVIVVHSPRLNVGVVIVQSEVDEPRHGFVIPPPLPVPKFSGASLKRNAIDCYTEEGATSKLRLLSYAWAQAYPEYVVLCGNTVRISTAGKLSRLMVGKSI